MKPRTLMWCHFAMAVTSIFAAIALSLVGIYWGIPWFAPAIVAVNMPSILLNSYRFLEMRKWVFA